MIKANIDLRQARDTRDSAYKRLDIVMDRFDMATGKGYELDTYKDAVETALDNIDTAEAIVKERVNERNLKWKTCR